MNFRAYLMSVNLHGIHKDDIVESSIQPKGKLISLNNGDRVVQNKVLHCDGLLLCITRDHSRLVVWNPYCMQTRWIEPRNSYHIMDNYTLGYEMKNKSHRSHKILRYLDAYDESVVHKICEYEIYNFDSNSWKAVEVTPNWNIGYYQRGVSLKGKTYWNAQDNIPRGEGEMEGETLDFLICFDFTREKFGLRLRLPLPLPFHSRSLDYVILSSVREEQLAVLFQPFVSLWTEKWISNKIEPDAVSWSKLFLKFKMREIMVTAASFFVDQKNKVAVVFDKDKCVYKVKPSAYIIGENGYSKQVDLGESHRYSFPFVCSLFQVQCKLINKQSAPRGRRKRNQIIS